MAGTRTVTVTGAGVASVVPDAATLSVAGSHRAPLLADALAGAEQARAEVVRVAGDRARVASRGLSVWPAHDNEGNEVGFEARHDLQVRCSDLTTAGALVADLAAEVGNRLRIDAVALTCSDTSEAETRATGAAVADARRRAEHLAALADARLGQVLVIGEGSSSGVPRMLAAKAERADVAFEAGEQDVRVDVTVTFELV